MASTRNKNTKQNYNIEVKQNINQSSYMMNPHGAYGLAYQTDYAGHGFLQGHLPASELSKNYVDIESSLFGIGSTNLVEEQVPVVPNMNKLCFKNLYEPNKKIIMPRSLYISNNQRPFPV